MSEDKLPAYSTNKDTFIKSPEGSAARFVPPDAQTLAADPYELIRRQLRAVLNLPLVEKAGKTVDPLGMAGFPVEALPLVIKELVQDLAAVHQIDPALPAMAALGTLSGAIGRSVVVGGAYKEKQTYCNLYILVGAPPSYGKSVAADIAEPLKKASDDLLTEFEEEERFNQESIQNLAKQSIKRLEAELGEDVSSEREKEVRKEIITERKRLAKANVLLNCPPAYMVGSLTIAAFEEMLIRNKEHLFSYSPEAGERVRDVMGKSATIMDLLLSGYSVEAKMRGTYTRGQKNITPCLSLLWMMQPVLLTTFFGASNVSERGLSSRFLPLLIEDYEVPLDDGEEPVRDVAAMNAWEALINKTLGTRDATTTLKASKDAKTVFKVWNNDVAIFQNEGYREFRHEIGRCREQAIRISGVLATAAGSKTITKKIAEDAVEISRWCLGQMLMILAGREMVAFEADKKELKRIINEKKKDDGRATVRDIKKGKKAFTDERLKELCAKYPETFAWEKKATGGRSSLRIRLVE